MRPERPKVGLSFYDEMTFAWNQGAYNARASFNRWFRVNVSAKGWPTAYPTGIPVNFEYPDVPLPFPSFSVTHLGEFDGQQFQGDRVAGGTGSIRYALSDISCWVSGQGNAIWNLWQMRDMVAYLCQSARSIPILNLYATTATAQLTAINIARLGPGGAFEDMEPIPDISPNIHRHRMVVHWFYQAAV